jgi:hypothetical protein
VRKLSLQTSWVLNHAGITPAMGTRLADIGSMYPAAPLTVPDAAALQPLQPFLV